MLLLGELGSGKSLAAERVLQQAAERAFTEPSAPLPVFVDASRGSFDLDKTIQRVREEVDHDPENGFLLVIDGAEQSGVDEILLQVRAACHWQRNTTALITARPMQGLAAADERVDMPLLEESVAYNLVSAFAGRKLSVWEPSNWPESVRKSVRRPLFAILLGGFLCTRPAVGSATEVELIRSLVQQSLSRVKLDSLVAQQTLEAIALANTEAGAQKVHVSNVDASSALLQSLVRSGLLTLDADYVGLSLPIFTEWFAAHALRNRGMPEELVADRTRLARWFYPLVIATAVFSHDAVSALLSPVARNDPGLAARIVSHAITQWGTAGPPDTELPSSLECGKRIVESMKAWVEGLGPLASRIAPVRPDGSLCKLGICAKDRRLVVAWGSPRSSDSGIVELEQNWNTLDNPGWSWASWHSPPANSAWAWRHAQRPLKYRLTQAIKERSLPVDTGPLAEEKMWRACLGLMRQGSLYRGTTELTPVEDLIRSFPESCDFQDFRGRLHSIDLVRVQLKGLRASGRTAISAPWPGPDITTAGGWVWSDYSSQRQVELIRDVFGQALQGYENLVKHWFPKFRHRLRTAAMLPARLVGRITPASADSEFGPTMGWYLEPLPREVESTIDIEVGPFTFEEALPSLVAAVKRYRSESDNVHMRQQVLHVFSDDPVSSLVYTWLEEDLKLVSWLT